MTAKPARMVSQLSGYVATGDYRLKQYYLVKETSATAVEICGAGESAAGVLTNQPNTGDNAGIFAFGLGEVIADGSGTAITFMCPLKSNATGVAVIAATDVDHCVGYSLKACTAAGDVIPFIAVPGSLSHA